MKQLRVLVILDKDLMPPGSLKGYSKSEIYRWKTEYDVVSTLRASGHEVHPLGVSDELRPIREAIENWKPHVVFNLLVEFQGEVTHDQNVVSYLELMRMPYTGCNPRGMVLAREKDLSKQLVSHHRIAVPDFAVFPIGRKIRRPRRLAFPLIVKSLIEDFCHGGSRRPPSSTATRSWRSASDSSTRASALRRLWSSISMAVNSTSACWATSGCACCRFGNSASPTCRRVRCRSPRSG